MRVYAIGDIHGCYDELVTLMDKIEEHAKGFTTPYKIVFLGDYIDRGPNSRGVIEYLINLKKERPNDMVFLMGNHDLMMINTEKYCEVWLSNGGIQTILEYSPDLNPDDILDTHLDFVRSLKRYHVEGSVAFAHANIDPDRLCEDTNDAILLWSRGFREIKHFHYKYTVHGHTPIGEALATDSSAYIDTGCVFGNKLTALHIRDCDNPDPDNFDIIEVSSYK